MILLDTNVVSEAMKPEPHPSVRDWLDAQEDQPDFRIDDSKLHVTVDPDDLPNHPERKRLEDARRAVGLDLIARPVRLTKLERDSSEKRRLIASSTS